VKGYDVGGALEHFHFYSVLTSAARCGFLKEKPRRDGVDPKLETRKIETNSGDWRFEWQQSGVFRVHHRVSATRI